MASEETATRSRTSGRIPPQDLDAEKSLLGAMLISDSAFADVLDKIKHTDFYDKRHAEIFHAMTNLYDNHRPIDLTTLTDQLRSQKTLKAVGGAPYLAELTNFVPTASHASAYADIIAKTATQRKLIAAGSKIVEKAYEDDAKIEDLLGDAERELFEVSDKNQKSDYVALQDLLVDAYDRIESLHKNKGSLRGLKTGFHDLDKLTAGFQPGDLIIVGARPAMGKTTFAQNLSYSVAELNKKGVLFFSLEMSQEEIVDRMISDVAGVDSWSIRTGNVSDEDFARIGDALGEMDNIPLYIDQTSGMSILDLRNKARRAIHEHDDIGLIVIDYLQLLQGTDRYAGNRVQEVTEISRGLKTLARELNVPVIALSQLNRGTTDSSRKDNRPVLSDLRESGSIEQDADLVIMLHRPDYYHVGEEGYEDTNITEVILAKHRHGPTGIVELYFQKNLNRLVSVDKNHE